MNNLIKAPLDSYELLMELQKATVQTVIKDHGLGSEALIVELVLALENEYNRWQTSSDDRADRLGTE